MSRLIQNAKITAHYGRLETRPAKNDLAEDLAQYMASLGMRIDMEIYQNLVTGAQLAAAANTFISLKPAFFADCMY